MTSGADSSTLLEPRSATMTLPWIDVAKGICILLVVLMHTVLGIDQVIGQGGYLRDFVAWTAPFRIPDFFLISGFLAAGIGSLGWRRFLDRRVLHYVYFYILWLGIVLFVKAVPAGREGLAQLPEALLTGLFEPFSTLWFIFVLPFLMLLARYAHGKMGIGIGAAAILLHLVAASHPAGGAYAMASDWSNSTAINSIALFLVFFLAGYAGHEHIRRLVAQVGGQPLLALALLLVWAIMHTGALRLGIATLPGITLALGLAGSVALVVLATLLTRLAGFGWLAYCGRHSLAIYLAFVIPMAASRQAIAKTSLISQPDLFAILVVVTAIALPLVLERLARGNRLQFLFKRPGWARIA